MAKKKKLPEIIISEEDLAHIHDAIFQYLEDIQDEVLQEAKRDLKAEYIDEAVTGLHQVQAFQGVIDCFTTTLDVVLSDYINIKVKS